MTIPKDFAKKLRDNLSQVNVAVRNGDFDRAEKLLAESTKYTGLAKRVDQHFETKSQKSSTFTEEIKHKNWIPYLDTYLTFLAGYFFAGLLIIGYQIYIDRGTLIGQIFSWGFLILIFVPIMFRDIKSRPECRDCNGRILQAGERCCGRE